MALVRDYEHQGKRFKVTVNQDGPRYVAVLDFVDMKPTPALTELTASSEEDAFKLGQRKGEELIASPRPGAPRIPDQK